MAETTNVPKKVQTLKSSLKKGFKNEEVKFRLLTSMKLSLVPAILFLIFASYLWVFMEMDLYFLKSHGFVDEAIKKNAYYDFIFSQFWDDLIFFAFFFISLNLFAGLYIADLILRPFRLISNCCEEYVLSGKISYNTEYLVDLKVLTTFSEYFFNTIENAIEHNELKQVKVPSKFTKIHRPVFEFGFFVNFSFYILIVFISMSIAMFILFDGVNTGIIEIVTDNLKASTEMTNGYLKSQTELLKTLMFISIPITLLIYLLFALHLYKHISAPAFAVFATLRSYLKGQHQNRIHLVGYYYVRDYCRNINKFLDKIQREIVQKGESE